MSISRLQGLPTPPRARLAGYADDAPAREAAAIAKRDRSSIVDITGEARAILAEDSMPKCGLYAKMAQCKSRYRGKNAWTSDSIHWKLAWTIGYVIPRGRTSMVTT